MVNAVPTDNSKLLIPLRQQHCGVKMIARPLLVYQKSGQIDLLFFKKIYNY